MGDAAEKITALERFDSGVVAPVLEYLESSSEPYRLCVCPDHPTFISTRTHDASPVPYAACGSNIEPGGFAGFSESEAARGGPHFDPGYKLLDALINWR